MSDDSTTTQADPKDTDTGTDTGDGTKNDKTLGIHRSPAAPQVDPNTGDDGTDKPAEPKDPNTLGMGK